MKSLSIWAEVALLIKGNKVDAATLSFVLIWMEYYRWPLIKHSHH